MNGTEAQDYAKLLAHTREKPTVKNLHWSGKDQSAPYLLVAAPPKSGSTWVTNVLGRSLGADRVRYCYAWASNEHDIYPPALLAHQSAKTIAQMHMRATPHNIQLILDFQIRTVLLTRNVYDSVASFARDLKMKSDVNVQLPGIVGYAFVWLQNTHPDWSASEWIDYSIDYYLPWYINFLSSWSQYAERVNAKRLRYEKLFEDEVASFDDLIDALEPGSKLDHDVLGHDFTTKNVSSTRSETGAGRKEMSDAQIARIERLFKPVRDVWVKSHLSGAV